ncbi:MAG: polysaccharide deacetylase family protein, partial [Firmicutes bacterium]|nr:polysaccharide deacetylase family protein [Bacillota bacterium]
MRRWMIVVLLLISCTLGCSDQKATPIYSQEETLVEGESGEDLEPHTGALAISELGTLPDQQVTWGPGREVDELNRPTACINLQEQYAKYDAMFLTQSNGIWLTFDEGYENGYTAAILDTLKQEEVSAVFFVTLDYVKSEPELVQRMIDEGHVVGNHTAYHPNMTQVTLEKAAENIQVLHDYMLDEFGYTMTLFLNPEGAFSEQVLALTQSMGYKSVLWSFAYNDWNVNAQPNPDTALQKLTEALHPGAIYLLHAVSPTNAQILKDW